MSENTDAIAVGCGVMLLVTPAIVAIHFALDGWVLSILWGWFVATPFGLPTLGWAHAAALSMLLGFSVRRLGAESMKDHTVKPIAGIIFLLVSPFMFLLAGWILQKVAFA